MEIVLSRAVETKLAAVSKSVGRKCQIIYDREVKYWYVFFVAATGGHDHPRYKRQNVGSGTTAELALDDALRNPKAVKGTRV